MTCKKRMKDMSLLELKTKLESSVCSAVRFTHVAERLGEEYESRTNPDPDKRSPTGAILAIQTGSQCTVSGTGDMYKSFQQSKDINKYSGVMTDPTKYHDVGWEDSRFRSMTFDQSFHRMPYDCRQSPAFDENKDVLFKKPRRRSSKGNCSAAAGKANDDVDDEATVDDNQDEDDDDGENDDAASTSSKGKKDRKRKTKKDTKGKETKAEKKKKYSTRSASARN